MSKEVTHDQLVARAGRWLKNTRGCRVVVLEHSGLVESPDAIGWRRGSTYSWDEARMVKRYAFDESVLIECKVTRADFRCDADKPFRKLPATGMGQYRYFLTPAQLVSVSELPPGWGLLEALNERVVRVVQHGVKMDCSREAEFALLQDQLFRYQYHGLTYPPFGGEVFEPLHELIGRRCQREANRYGSPDVAYQLARLAVRASRLAVSDQAKESAA